jgi:hypothetical protein
MARKSMIDEAFTLRVCARVRNGLRLQSALEAEGIDKRNLEYWRREAERGNQQYSDFLAAVAGARAQFESETLDVIRLQATPTDHGEIQDWKARAWMLERMMPEAYAPSQTMVLKAQDQAAQDVLEVAREVLPSQWYAALLAALSGVGEADAQADGDEGDEAH